MNVCQSNRFGQTDSAISQCASKHTINSYMLRWDKWISIFYHEATDDIAVASVTLFTVHSVHSVYCLYILFYFIFLLLFGGIEYVTWKPMPFHHVNGDSQSFFLWCREIFYSISLTHSLTLSFSVLSFLFYFSILIFI